MRELKFRAFNGKYMDEVVGYEYNYGSFDKDVTIVFDEKEGINAYLTKDLNVMQYIGLKDIRGKEIYEGDIVKFKFDGETKISEIKADVLNGTTVSFKSFGNDYNFNLSRIYSDDRKLEVIGNIYENKELLEM